MSEHILTVVISHNDMFCCVDDQATSEHSGYAYKFVTTLSEHILTIVISQYGTFCCVRLLHSTQDGRTKILTTLL